MPIRRHLDPRSARAAAPGSRRAGSGLFLFVLGVAVGAAGSWLAGHGSLWRTPAGIAGVGSEAKPSGEPAAPGARTGRHAGAAHRHGAARTDAAPGSHQLDAAPGLAAAGEIAGGAAGGAGSTARAALDKEGPAAGPARVALVIDDLGRSLEELDDLHRLGVPITYAVLPFESQTPEVVATLRRRHDEILCHLPMEPKSGGNPGPGALREGMSPEQLRQSTLAAIAAVPGAVGVNNHMGSALSADPGSMSTILGVLAERGLFFLDSRTSAQSVGYRIATSLGIPAAERQIFLDDDPRPPAVAAEFQRLLELARTRGAAIAIGHPHSATLATLATEVPRAQALGYRFVQVSALLDRPPSPPPPPTGR
ncbi:MAG TPA: divergent polysaccharide deacetylase family protein [Thermoanaerobaculia bacterium]|nr:divergent polysaccharide deacetylase family protein [Thermoanaerobaculia bacterium]